LFDRNRLYFGLSWHDSKHTTESSFRLKVKKGFKRTWDYKD